MTQLTFPVKAQSQLEEKFLEFHSRHPEVYAALSRFAHQWRDRKGPYARLGIKMVIERVRWELALGAKDETPRLNNNHSAFYARLLMAQEPALEGMFFLKKQRYESTISTKEEREGEPPNLQGKIPLAQGLGRKAAVRRWNEIVQAQLEAQLNAESGADDA